MAGNDSLIDEIDLQPDESFKYEIQSSVGYSKSLTSPVGPLRYIVGVTGVSFVLFMIYVIYQLARFSQNREQVGIREVRTNRFGTRVVEITNPLYTGLVDTIARNRMLTGSNIRVDASPLEDYSSAYSLDLPPSYVNSVHYDSPPSYEEAVTFSFNISQHV
ncbi:hypothetical protein RI129_012557 [Pyrocoelia pectoralis]|uniref:Uncharacterized protein n=1 Tax=Pyrocoelia pectoralis TaxID=417401 RepID=A0AAN7UYB6_9COLE